MTYLSLEGRLHKINHCLNKYNCVILFHRLHIHTVGINLNDAFLVFPCLIFSIAALQWRFFKNYNTLIM